ncbi:hypothetical protein ACWEVP_31785 [Amycolatopsis sp. NPDC003865]
MTGRETQPFYRYAVVDGLQALGYDPDASIQLDYTPEDSTAGPCLALPLKDANELAYFAVVATRHLCTNLVQELADGWVQWLAQMVMHARTDGRKYYFPGWTLTP